MRLTTNVKASILILAFLFMIAVIALSPSETPQPGAANPASNITSTDYENDRNNGLIMVNGQGYSLSDLTKVLMVFAVVTISCIIVVISRTRSLFQAIKPIWKRIKK
jgi:hypothetical protein